MAMMLGVAEACLSLDIAEFAGNDRTVDARRPAMTHSPAIYRYTPPVPPAEMLPREDVIDLIAARYGA